MPKETRDLTINEALELGLQFAASANDKGAIAIYRGVLMHEPENLTAILRLGASLFKERQYYEALYWFWRARKIDRRNLMALTNYGLTLSQLDHCKEGLVHLERAVWLANNNPPAPEHMALLYNNLGNTLVRLERFEEAMHALKRSVAHNATDQFAHYNFGIVYLRLGRHQDALDSFNRALELTPDDDDALYNRAIANLILGNLKQGFCDYEARLTNSANEEQNHLGIVGKKNLGLPAQKKWSGVEPIEGKRLLVHCEQGLGDTIQCLRFVQTLIDRGAHILLMAQSTIRPLIGPHPSVEVLSGESPVDFHYWLALMSMPFYLGIEREEQIPPPWTPSVEPERVEKWRADLALPADKVKVGVCWAGNFRNKNDEYRSIPLDKFSALFNAAGCHFVSLQQMRDSDLDTFAKLKTEHSNLTGTELTDLRDTAAIIQSLDLVISVDTAVGHLAATLGVPTEHLVAGRGMIHWPWGLKRAHTGWYPAMKIHRQDPDGSWRAVLEAVRNRLESFERLKVLHKAA